MVIPVYTLSLLMLFSSIPGIYGTCSDTDITCTVYSDYTICSINAANASRASFLIKECSIELAQTGETYIRFNVYLQENGGTVTLNIAENITEFSFYISGMNSINVINIHADLNHLYIYATGSLYCPYDLLKYFPNLRTLILYSVRFDRFPLFNSTSLISLYLLYLTLPNVVTIQPPMLFLPNLDFIELYQTEFQEWFQLIPSSFDNTSVSTLFLSGLQHLYSYQFANIPLLTRLYLLDFYTDFTFEENVLSGLDTLTYLDIRYSQTNIDFLINDTFPSLTKLYLFYTATTTLYQTFFERQKALSIIDATYVNQFHCDCKMAWLSHVTTELGWTVLGTCATPASLSGNSITDSTNYLSCPNNQSYHCFNDTIICPQGISCVNTGDSAYCDCGEGYTLHASTSTCLDTNECSTTNDCGQICINNIGSYECSCMSGYSLEPDLFSCRDTNECSTTNDCGQICINNIGSYECSCMSGYSLEPDLFSCRDTNECSTTNDCGQICINNIGSYECSCMSGYSLEPDLFSCRDTNECSTTNDCGQICINTIGSYECSCMSGYSLEPDLFSCRDNNECSTTNDCGQICINTIGSYECSCMSGYSLEPDLFSCRDTNECSTTNDCGQICINTIGSYECSCMSGYSLEPDLFSCRDTNECSTTNDCGQICINNIGSYECSCMSGYSLEPDLFSCRDNNECSTTNNCKQICTNIIGSYECSCMSGYSLQADLFSCVKSGVCQLTAQAVIAVISLLLLITVML